MSGCPQSMRDVAPVAGATEPIPLRHIQRHGAAHLDKLGLESVTCLRQADVSCY